MATPTRVRQSAAAVAAAALVGVAVAAGLLMGGNHGSGPTAAAPSAAAVSAAADPAVDPGESLGGRPAPGFTLTNQHGQPTSLRQFRGKAVLLAFVDSQCTTICPLTTQSMAAALDLLGPAASSVQLLGINANPDATSVADVAAYTQAHGLTHQWQFLTGTTRQLAQVWHEYAVYVAASHGNIDHEPVLYLIGPHGRERRVYLTQMAYAGVPQQAQIFANALARVLPSHPRVPQRAAIRFLPPVLPTVTSTLPLATGSGRVQIGAGHPHLLVFFASWLSETSDLPAQLRALNQYAVAAHRHGWPSPVAVDQGSTEQPGALAALLTRLGPTLDYPVAVDTTGQVSDGYQVTDTPLLELTDAHGHVAFKNDGWFPLPKLLAAVAAAQHP